MYHVRFADIPFDVVTSWWGQDPSFDAATGLAGSIVKVSAAITDGIGSFVQNGQDHQPERAHAILHDENKAIGVGNCLTPSSHFGWKVSRLGDRSRDSRQATSRENNMNLAVGRCG